MEFTKYKERGSYHWKLAFPKRLIISGLADWAKYDIVVKLLKQRINLEGALGLDAGCGDGVLLYKIISAGGTIIGLDDSFEGLLLQKKEFLKRALKPPEAINADCLNIPIKDESFDYVVCMDVIEHLNSVDSFLEEVKRIIRPGGYFICVTINRLKNQNPNAVRDSFHIHEFSGQELGIRLRQLFGKVDIFGASHFMLDRLYKNKLSCLIIRIMGIIYNPYLSLKLNPDYRWHRLVAVAVK